MPTEAPLTPTRALLSEMVDELATRNLEADGHLGRFDYRVMQLTQCALDLLGLPDLDETKALVLYAMVDTRLRKLQSLELLTPEQVRGLGVELKALYAKCRPELMELLPTRAGETDPPGPAHALDAITVTGTCDAQCGQPATVWFRSSSTATCGQPACVAVLQAAFDEATTDFLREDPDA
jgi:hypothetical protein